MGEAGLILEKLREASEKNNNKARGLLSLSFSLSLFLSLSLSLSLPP